MITFMKFYTLILIAFLGVSCYSIKNTKIEHCTDYNAIELTIRNKIIRKYRIPFYLYDKSITDSDSLLTIVYSYNKSSTENNKTNKNKRCRNCYNAFIVEIDKISCKIIDVTIWH